MNHIKESFGYLERRHPYLFLLILLALCFAVLVAASSLMHGCSASLDPGAQGDSTTPEPPPFAALSGVQVEGAGKIKATAELEIAGEEVVVIIEGFGVGAAAGDGATKEGQACAVVTFRWGFVRFTQGYPKGCSLSPTERPAPVEAQSPASSSPSSPIVNP
jgi:hypothetical protein